MSRRHVVGCMSGTSLDAVDAALVAVDGAGLEMTASVLACATRPLDNLADPLRQLAARQPMSADQIATLSRELALHHIATVRDLAGHETADLVAVHGQTVYHAPPASWQLLTAAPIAQAFGVPVVFDLRAADLAAGGQGAPITPLADWVLFRHRDESRAILNLGGFANYTLVPACSAQGEQAARSATDGIRGGDICACNQLLDAIARAVFDQPFDAGGERAAAGRVQSALCESLRELLEAQATANRSLGTGDELESWIRQHRGKHRGADLARSACAAVAMVIAGRLDRIAAGHSGQRIDRILAAGGGVKNATLLAELRQHVRPRVDLSDELGVPAIHREAAAMAVLGALCQDGVPITLPQVTGVGRPAPIAGVWVPHANVRWGTD